MPFKAMELCVNKHTYWDIFFGEGSFAIHSWPLATRYACGLVAYGANGRRGQRGKLQHYTKPKFLKESIGKSQMETWSAVLSKRSVRGKRDGRRGPGQY